MKFIFIFVIFGTFLTSFNGANAQFLRDLLSNFEGQENSVSRDDLPNFPDSVDELSFEQVICRDKEKFPIEISSKVYSNFHECKANLDRIQDASYIDLTYRIRWDSDRLDLFRSTNREILICDGNLLTTYVHNKRRDPDWWMIVRNSLRYIDCADEILIEEID
tara:strand:+ start:338 stop:826 length:489 start_codon:yes stop_codon:yes gene_type:complete